MAGDEVGVKIAAMEVRVSEIALLAVKIDKLTDSVNGMNLAVVSLKGDFVGKDECKAREQDWGKQLLDIKTDVSLKFTETRKGQKQLFWAGTTATITFIAWLIQQLFNLKLTMSGG